MVNVHNLAERIANFYYDYDYYDFNDSLEVGETMEDAIFKIERILSRKGGVDSYIDFIDEVIDSIMWERIEDSSDPNYGGDMLKRAKSIRNELYSLKDGRTGSFKEGKASPSKSKESAKVRELIDIIEAPHGLARRNGYRLLPDKLDIINGGQFKITKAQYNRLKELGYGTDESYKRRVDEGIKLNSVKKASVQGYDEYARIKMPRGFCACSVYLKDRDSNNFAFQVSEIHPYDEADYVWAQARNGIIKFVQGGKVVATMKYSKGDTCEEVLEKAIGAMRDLNKDVEPTKAIW